MAVSAPKQKFETTDRGSDNAGTQKEPLDHELKQAERFEQVNVRATHPVPRRYLELTQDIIVLFLCVTLLVSMVIKLVHLGQLLLEGADFSLVLGNILFILVLVELFRLLLIYLEEHRVSVATMVEVGIVGTLREVILIGALHIAWERLLVVCVFIITLVLVLRHAGIRCATDNEAK